MITANVSGADAQTSYFGAQPAPRKKRKTNINANYSPWSVTVEIQIPCNTLAIR